MRRPALLLAAVVTTLALPSAASAAFAPVPLAPATDQHIPRGTLTAFTVRALPGSSVLIGVGALNTPDGQGRLDRVVASGTAVDDGTGRFTFTLPEGSLPTQRPGRYFWQAVVVQPDGTTLNGPMRPVTFTAPAGRRTRIPASMGRQGKGTFLVSIHGIPPYVSSGRFYRLAKTSARRWGLRVAGWTRLKPGPLDRRNVIGFTRTLPADVWGRTTTRGYGGRVLDRDIALNGNDKWNAGPGYPAVDEGDLETTLIHELGHAAGNSFHVPRCANSPLVISGAPGEWWHAPDDVFFFECGAAR